MAQFNLGAFYLRGQGITQDDVELPGGSELVAAQGEPQAQHNLGVMHETGRGATQDYAQAATWYRLAATQGVGVTAQSRIFVRHTVAARS